MASFWVNLRNFINNVFKDSDADGWLMSEYQQKTLIVGLGNPGKKYAQNRHNLGFMVVNRFASKHDIPLSRVENKSIVGRGLFQKKPVLLAKPQTFMNNSGFAVGHLANYYKISRENILVVYDELDLPFGAIRLRIKGGAGGHNGMKSIIQALGPDFPRLRIGIGRPPGNMDPAAYVLKDFHHSEHSEVDLILNKGTAAVESFIAEGIEIAMNNHNI